MVLLDFSMTPLGQGESVSPYVARSLKIIDDSGLDYRLHAMGTIVEGEIDQGERDRNKAAGKPSSPPAGKSGGAKDYRTSQQESRKAEKEIKNLEKKIAKLDDDKKAINAKLMTETDPDEAVRLHEEITKITKQLESAEERWMELSDF